MTKSRPSSAVQFDPVDPARLDRSIDQTAEAFKFQKRPSAADIFDDTFLPPLGGRPIH